MKLPNHNGGCSRAFTLMELLIGLTVSAIVLSVIGGVFYGALQLRNKNAAAFNEKLPLNRAVAIIQRDLAGIVIPSTNGLVNTNIAVFGPLVTGETTTSGGASSATAMSQPNVTEFYTTTGVLDDDQPWGEVQKVSYQLVAPTTQTAGKDLVRFVTRNVLAASTDDQSTQQWLMGGVQNITFSYYDGTQWIDTWDTTAANATTGLTNMLPVAVKVQIELASEGSGSPAKTPVELVVPLFVQINTNIVVQ